mmetsp:Transcript_28449/g.47793  ORF Transcript_28449/g.47793 Transcript_28449/m.47793 type:complete len:989 (+) Transcript_28449:22-2988(+)
MVDLVQVILSVFALCTTLVQVRSIIHLTNRRPSAQLSSVGNAQLYHQRQSRIINPVADSHIITEYTVFLPDYLPVGSIGETIVFALSENKQVQGVITRITDFKKDHFVWHGAIADTSGGGSFYLSYASGAIVGNVYSADRTIQYEIRPLDPKESSYSIRAVPSAVYDVEPDDEAEHELHVEGLNRYASAHLDERTATQSTSKSLESSDTNNILDVMVVYTPEALAGYSNGDVDSMMALIDLSIDMSNDALANSNLNLRFRLVRAAQIQNASYVESGFNSDLSRLKKTADGHMDEEHTQRELYGADAVVLIVADYAYCGLAYLWASTPWAFGLISYNCPQSLVHEVGHNIGLHHDRTTVDTTDLSSYNYGWCWDTGSSSCKRSVMAYSGCITPNGQTGCPRDFYISSPLVTEGALNQATGDEYSDNARIVTEETSKAITWKDSVTPGGILFSASPSTVDIGLCSLVNITGWRIGTGSDITSVALNGIEVESIVYQTEDIVRVVTSAATTPGTGNITVTTSAGEVTNLEAAFTYSATSGSFLSSFESGASSEWVDTGAIAWQYVQPSSSNNGPLTGVDGSGQFAKLIASGATTDVGELTATYNDDSNCADTVTGFSFYYHRYSQYQSLCKGYLTVQALMDGSSNWTTVLEPTDFQSAQDSAWLYESYTFANPTTVKGIKFIADPYSGQDACWAWYSISLDEITVDRSTTCSNSGCPGSSPPSVNPTVSPTPIPSVAPTFGTYEQLTFNCSQTLTGTTAAAFLNDSSASATFLDTVASECNITSSNEDSVCCLQATDSNTGSDTGRRSLLAASLLRRGRETVRELTKFTPGAAAADSSSEITLTYEFNLAISSSEQFSDAAVAYATVRDNLISSVNSGAFVSALNAQLQQHSSSVTFTGAANISANSFSSTTSQTVTYTAQPSWAPTDSPTTRPTFLPTLAAGDSSSGSSSGGSALIIVIVVVVLILICGGAALFWYLLRNAEPRKVSPSQ